jgi:SAM-dependent methyltransferase
MIYEQNNFPVFQNRTYNTVEEAVNCLKGNIRLIQDLQTGLIYNIDFNPDLMDYNSNYQNEQAVSKVFQQHLEEVSFLVKKNIGCERLVEIGCGKGFFLNLLLKKGFDIIGFDPAYEGYNQKIRRQYFSCTNIQPFQGIILRHVLEHIKNPVKFLEKIKSGNGNKGKIYIEAPCFDWICEHQAWFDIFYEHVNYFRLSDFKKIFGRIIDCGKLFCGQYFYVIAELSSLKYPRIDANEKIFFPNFSLKKIVKQQFAVWGGSSKGVIFSLLMQQAGCPQPVIIDINPAKQGRYLPATGLLVHSPQDGLNKIPQGSDIYVMNSNYLDEIKFMSGNKYNYIKVDCD